MNLSPLEADILRAVRPGRMDTYTLKDRFGASYSATVSELVKKKLLQYSGDREVEITRLGRECCPARRVNRVVS